MSVMFDTPLPGWGPLMSIQRVCGRVPAAKAPRVGWDKACPSQPVPVGHHARGTPARRYRRASKRQGETGSASRRPTMGRDRNEGREYEMQRPGGKQPSLIRIIPSRKGKTTQHPHTTQHSVGYKTMNTPLLQLWELVGPSQEDTLGSKVPIPKVYAWPPLNPEPFIKRAKRKALH